MANTDGLLSLSSILHHVACILLITSLAHTQDTVGKLNS